jgi:hypothetical protein
LAVQPIVETLSINGPVQLAEAVDGLSEDGTIDGITEGCSCVAEPGLCHRCHPFYGHGQDLTDILPIHKLLIPVFERLKRLFVDLELLLTLVKCLVGIWHFEHLLLKVVVNVVFYVLCLLDHDNLSLLFKRILGLQKVISKQHPQLLNLMDLHALLVTPLAQVNTHPLFSSIPPIPPLFLHFNSV